MSEGLTTGAEGAEGTEEGGGGGLTGMERPDWVPEPLWDDEQVKGYVEKHAGDICKALKGAAHLQHTIGGMAKVPAADAAQEEWNKFKQERMGAPTSEEDLSDLELPEGIDKVLDPDLPAVLKRASVERAIPKGDVQFLAKEVFGKLTEKALQELTQRTEKGKAACQERFKNKHDEIMGAAQRHFAERFAAKPGLMQMLRATGYEHDPDLIEMFYEDSLRFADHTPPPGGGSGEAQAEASMSIDQLKAEIDKCRADENWGKSNQEGRALGQRVYEINKLITQKN